MIEITKGVLEFDKNTQGDHIIYINGRASNFKVKEFACHDGSAKVLIDAELLGKLQIIREHFNSPVVVNSGYRTVDYNRTVGGVNGSQHVLGKACDIVVKGKTPAEVAKYAKDIGFRGVGIYSDFVHVDTRLTRSYWYG